MRKARQRFTKNKETVRDLQRDCIERHLKAKLGKLRYFGLPASTLEDARAWSDIFSEFAAVERGEPNREWELQHELELEAFKSKLFDKLGLFRGDIDSIIEKGRDQFGKKPRFPFDVVSLDYSGGLFYRDKKGNFARLKAVSALIERQATAKRDFVLLLSCNLDQVDQGEVRKTIENLRTEIVRYGCAADGVIDAYLKHEREEARLKLYVPYFVNVEAAKNHMNCETEKVIFYEGNRSVRMMAFRFFLTFDERTQSLRPPRERLSQIINRALVEVQDGVASETLLGLPKLELPETRGSNDVNAAQANDARTS